MRFTIILTLASLLPAPERAPEPPLARWPSAWDNQIPLWSGTCPRSYTAWRYDRRRNPVCVQSI
jgi:hypothetical protein